METPTKDIYKFTGHGIRARSDISIYGVENHNWNNQVNVELKAKNPYEEMIKKDIHKLINEKVFIPNLVGNWFHILENIDKKFEPRHPS